MTLVVDTLTPDRGWLAIGRLEAGEQPGSLSHVTDQGVREMYLFAPVTDYFSVIVRSNLGTDAEIARQIRLVSAHAAGLELVHRIMPGETVEMDFNLGIEYDELRWKPAPGETRHVRFQHVLG